MPYILCATDFKEAAFNALQFACGLCRQFDTELIVLHSQSISNKLVKIISRADAETKEKMQGLVKKIHMYFPDVKCSGVVLEGDISTSLNDYVSNNGEPELVVIGNNYNAENPAFMNGHLLTIFKHLKCPVIAIPKNKSFQPVKKICFAFDNKIEGAEDALTRLRDFTIAHNLELHIIMGWEDGFSRDNLPEINPAADQIIAPAKPSHHFIPMKNLDHVVDEFAVKNHMEWIVIIPRKHTYIGDMLHKSHTQHLINSAHMPIMALHEQ